MKSPSPRGVLITTIPFQNKLRWYPQQPQRFLFNLFEACSSAWPEAKRCKHLSWVSVNEMAANPVERDLALHQSLPDLLHRNPVEPDLALQPCWTWPGSAPKPPRPSPGPSEPSPEPCWTWPGSAPKPPRPSPPEPCWTWLGFAALLNLTWLCTKASQTFSGTFGTFPKPCWTWPGAHRSYSGLKTPLAYVVGEKQEIYLKVLFDASTEAYFFYRKKHDYFQALWNFHQPKPANPWAFQCHIPRCRPSPPNAHPSAAATAGLSAVLQRSAPSGGLHQVWGVGEISLRFSRTWSIWFLSLNVPALLRTMKLSWLWVMPIQKNACCCNAKTFPKYFGKFRLACPQPQLPNISAVIISIFRSPLYTAGLNFSVQNRAETVVGFAHWLGCHQWCRDM